MRIQFFNYVFLLLLFDLWFFAHSAYFVDNKVLGTSGNNLVISGLTYRIKSNFNAKVLSCSGDHIEVYPDPGNKEDWASLFVLIPNDRPNEGSFRIQCRVGQKVLSQQALEKSLFPVHILEANLVYSSWDLIPIPSEDGSFRIRNIYSDHVLNIHGDANLVYPLVQKEGWHHTFWQFIPQIYEIKASITDVQYTGIEVDLAALGKPDTALLWTMTNGGYQHTDTYWPTIRDEKEIRTSWSFSHSQETSFFNQLDVDVSFKNPFLKVHAHNTLIYRTEKRALEERREEKFQSHFFEIKGEIRVPPRHQVEYITTCKKIDTDIPFKARAKVRGYGDRLKKDGSNIWSDFDALTTSSVIAHRGLAVSGNAKYIGTEGSYVIFELDGTLHAEGATNCVTTKKETKISDKDL